MSRIGPEPNTETLDAERVDTALHALSGGDTNKAESLLTEVIQNAPTAYVYEYDDDGTLSIKFWDQQEFIHYVTWTRQQGTERSIEWLPSAYPRAFYWLGFLKVKTQTYDQAVAFLDRGHNMEPTNPKFNLEKAQALFGLGHFTEALELYDEIKTVGPHISGRDVAAALRGRGFILAEMGKLDEAERALEESLKLEISSVAVNELRYVKRRRFGAPKADTAQVVTSAPNLGECRVCGQRFTRGVVANVDGSTVSICRECDNKLSKKWWHFWK